MTHRAQPTQTRRPWHAVARTVLAAMIGLLPVLPMIAQALEIESIPVVASVLAVTAAVTRVLALPEIETWLRRFAPWLAADVYPDRKEERND